jgi:hypothetical protein
MSHAEAELYIQPPIFETRVAAQMIAYVRCLNGLHIEEGGGLAVTVIVYGPARVEPTGDAQI